MNAPDLFDLLGEHAPEFGVTVPEDNAVFWNAYFRELREFRGEAVAYGLAAWKRGEFDPKQPLLATIFPQPWQLAHLARQWRPPSVLETVAGLSPLPDHLRPRLSPEEVAQRIRDYAPPLSDDEVIL